MCMCALVVIYGRYDPASNPFPRCMFKSLTGLDCPGCGSQRAFHALLQGHPIDALRYNLLLALAVPAMLVAALGEWAPQRFPRLARLVHSPRAVMALFYIIVLWWIVRNIAGV